MVVPDRISGKQREGVRLHLFESRIGHIPATQKPKSRPPDGMRDKWGFLYRALPKYSGPYNVGTMEIEVPAERPRTFSNITRHQNHIIQLETVLMTVYYPSASGSGLGPSPAGQKKWSRQTWLPRPRFKVARGYGRFASVGSLAVPFFAATSMFTKLPAFRNAPLATHWPPSKNVKVGRRDVKDSAGEPPPGEPEVPRFPLLIFSHGLGGTRTLNSSVCGEFASYGFVVVAVEHRDGSAPLTFVNHPPEGLGSREERQKKGNIDYPTVNKEKDYDSIQYVFPKHNKYDTDPKNKKGVDRMLRSAQIELRLAEIEEAYNVMCTICRGEGAKVAQTNLRRKGYIGSSSQGLEGIDWTLWKNRFHIKQVTIVGHSFGAATAVEMLRRSDSFPWISQGIIYDIWGAGVNPPEEKSSHHPIKLPLLAINSEAFVYWESNFALVQSLVDEARHNGALAWSMTVKGTVHITVSDFPMLYPNFCSFFLKMTAEPRRALDLNITASLEFLKAIMPTRLAQINRALSSEGLLERPVLNRESATEYELREPKQKYVALRLSIQHEFVYRVAPGFARKRVRRKAEKAREKGGKQPLDQSIVDDEVWMHAAPTDEELERHGINRTEGSGEQADQTTSS